MSLLRVNPSFLLNYDSSGAFPQVEFRFFRFFESSNFRYAFVIVVCHRALAIKMSGGVSHLKIKMINYRETTGATNCGADIIALRVVLPLHIARRDRLECVFFTINFHAQFSN